MLLQFTYDADGFPTAITDGDGNVTTIERTGSTPTAIVSPAGKRTILATDANGWLSRITDPANESRSLQSSAGGLLQQLTDPRANVRHFSYDSAGRLTRDEDAAGGSTTRRGSEQANGFTVTTTTALGRSRSYQFEGLSDGSQRRTFVATDGTTTVARTAPDGSAQITLADGTVATIQSGPDPRWGMLAPLPAKSVEDVSEWT